MIKNNSLKKLLLLGLIIISVFPLFITTDYQNFMNHPFQKTDIYWKQPQVDCIKSFIIENQNIEFAWINDNGFQKFDLYTSYLYQYLFSPIILLDLQNGLPNQFIVYFTGDDKSMLIDNFENYTLYECDGNLYYLRLKESK